MTTNENINNNNNNNNNNSNNNNNNNNNNSNNLYNNPIALSSILGRSSEDKIDIKSFENYK